MQIEISNYPVFVRLGCLPEEEKGQDVLVSLIAEYKTPPRIDEANNSSDGLIDYAEVCAFIDTFDQRRIYFVESLVQMIGKELLRLFPPLKKVEVCVEKVRFPSYINKGASISVSEVFAR